MLNLYGKRYAKNAAEFTRTLFDGDSTANGYYKVTKHGVFLLDMQRTQRAFIRKDGLGPVTASRHNGKTVYMYGLVSIDSFWLGVPDSYLASCKGAAAAVAQVFNSVEA